MKLINLRGLIGQNNTGLTGELDSELPGPLEVSRLQLLQHLGADGQELVLATPELVDETRASLRVLPAVERVELSCNSCNRVRIGFQSLLLLGHWAVQLKCKSLREGRTGAYRHLRTGDTMAGFYRYYNWVAQWQGGV